MLYKNSISTFVELYKKNTDHSAITNFCYTEHGWKFEVQVQSLISILKLTFEQDDQEFHGPK